MNKNITIIFDDLLKDRTLEDQVKVLRYCLELHALDHPWVNEELADSIVENIQNDKSLKFEPVVAPRTWYDDHPNMWHFYAKTMNNKTMEAMGRNPDGSPKSPKPKK